MKNNTEKYGKNEKLPEGNNEDFEVEQILKDLEIMDELVDDLFYLISLIYLLDAFLCVIDLNNADVPKELSDMMGAIRSVASSTVDKWDAYASME